MNGERNSGPAKIHRGCRGSGWSLGVILTTPRAHPDPSFTSDVRSTLNDPLVPHTLVGHLHRRLQRGDEREDDRGIVRVGWS